MTEIKIKVSDLQRKPQTLLAAQQVEGRVNSYRVPKIPRFCAEDPVFWFSKVESTFNTAKIIVKKTRADYLIQELDMDILSCARDLISAENNPADIYTQIKGYIPRPIITSSARDFECFGT